MRVAAWQYPIERLASWDAWRQKLEAGIAEAVARGAELCVVPEYASMELTSLLAPEVQGDLAAQLGALQPLLPGYVEAYAELARRHRIAIVAGSFPEACGGGYRNRLRVHGPGGATVEIEKLQMTRFERERWGISGGAGQVVIDLGSGAGTGLGSGAGTGLGSGAGTGLGSGAGTGLGSGAGSGLGGVRLGVAICYDAEFPLVVRRLAAAGAQVIAVPSCTDGLAGYHRVRIACAARALESQCYVVQAPTVGVAPWSIAVDENVGAAGVFAPADRGLPDDGVVALGTLNAPGWLVADLDLAAIERARADGQVLGHRDWDREAHLAGEVARATLAP